MRPCRRRSRPGWRSTRGGSRRWAGSSSTPRSLGQIVADEFGGDPEAVVEFNEDLDEDDGEINWAGFFNVPRLAQGFLLPDGTESRRIYMLTERPDRTGDYPVLWIDIDDQPALGVMYPGFDVWLGEHAGLLSIKRETYSGAFADRRFQTRCRHHARVATHGKQEVEYPADHERAR